MKHRKHPKRFKSGLTVGPCRGRSRDWYAGHGTRARFGTRAEIAADVRAFRYSGRLPGEPGRP